MRVIARMTPEHEALDMTMRATAPESVIEVARQLQRAAFQDEKLFADGFDPAPLYLRQAFVLWTNLARRGAVVRAIGDL